MFIRIVLLLLFILVFVSCSEESSTETSKASISGNVTFLDGTATANAQIRLIVTQSNQNKFTNTDQNGNYKFNDLAEGKYEIGFTSLSYDINSYRSEEIALSGNNVEHNFNITYNMLDELKVMVVSDSLFFIQFQPEGARIGSNTGAVSKLLGYYRPNAGSSITLECDIYEVPNEIVWEDATWLTPKYVSENFAYSMSLTETASNFNHSLEISGENLEKILSNPSNGFVFIKKIADDKILKVPCVDFNNNDFGFRIQYN
jgi:hypothetical protein